MQLHQDLKEIAARDPDQEVRGLAVPVIDAVVTACVSFLDEEDPVFEKIRQLFSVEALESGEPLRAVDAQIAAGAALPGASGTSTIRRLGRCSKRAAEIGQTGPTVSIHVHAKRAVEQENHKNPQVGSSGWVTLPR